MRKHTPGPWEVEPTDRNDIHFRGWFDIYGDTDSGPDRVWLCEAETEADARLIAAAPELLDALEMVMQHGLIDDSESRMNQVAAAIAKARQG